MGSNSEMPYVMMDEVRLIATLKKVAEDDVAGMYATLEDMGTGYAGLAVKMNALVAHLKKSAGEQVKSVFNDAWDDVSVSQLDLQHGFARGCTRMDLAHATFVEIAHALELRFAEKDRALRKVTECYDALAARHKEHAIHKPDVRDAVWAITGGKCFYCRVDLIRTAEDATSLADGHRLFHVDHLVAKDCGGPDHMANYIPSCQRCNLSKSNKPFAEFSRRHEQQPQLSVIEGGAA